MAATAAVSTNCVLLFAALRHTRGKPGRSEAVTLACAQTGRSEAVTLNPTILIASLAN